MLARPSQDGVQRPKSAKLVVVAICCISFERYASAIACADQGANAGTGDDVDGNAGVFQGANDTNMRDTTGEAAGKGQAYAGTLAGGEASPVAKERSLSVAFFSQSLASATLSSSMLLSF